MPLPQLVLWHEWTVGQQAACWRPGENDRADIKRSELGLIEIRSHPWRDVVWINVNGNALKFRVVVADAMECWCKFEQSLFHGSAESRFNLEVNCDWKLAAENFYVSYHLLWV